jgi:hypothetical protein
LLGRRFEDWNFARDTVDFEITGTVTRRPRNSGELSGKNNERVRL